MVFFKNKNSKTFETEHHNSNRICDAVGFTIFKTIRKIFGYKVSKRTYEIYKFEKESGYIKMIRKYRMISHLYHLMPTKKLKEKVKRYALNQFPETPKGMTDEENINMYL